VGSTLFAGPIVIGVDADAGDDRRRPR